MLKAELANPLRMPWPGSPIGLARSARDKESLPLFERDVHQHLIAFNIDHVAEGPLAAAGEVEPDTTAPGAHVANAQVLQKLRQPRVHHGLFFPGSGWAE